MSAPLTPADEQLAVRHRAAPAGRAGPRLLDAPVRARACGPAPSEPASTAAPRPDGTSRRTAPGPTRRGQGGRALLAGPGAGPADRPRRRALPGGAQVARGPRRRAAAGSWWPTAPRASRRARRTRPCCSCARTSCWTGWRWPPRPWALAAAVVWLHEGDRADRAGGRPGARRAAATGRPSRSTSGGRGPDHYLTGESSAVVRALSGGPALPYLARQPGRGRRCRRPARRSSTTPRRWPGSRWSRAAVRAPSSDGPLVTVVGQPERRRRSSPAPARPSRELLRRSGVVTCRPAAGRAGRRVRRELAALGRGSRPSRCRPGSARRSAPRSAPASIAPLDARCLRAGRDLGAARLPRRLERAAVRTVPVRAAGDGRAVRRAWPAGRCSRADLRRLERYAGEVSGRGACHHPDGAVRLVALRAAHLRASTSAGTSTDGPCAGAARPALLPVPGWAECGARSPAAGAAAGRPGRLRRRRASARTWRRGW